MRSNITPDIFVFSSITNRLTIWLEGNDFLAATCLLIHSQHDAICARVITPESNTHRLRLSHSLNWKLVIGTRRVSFSRGKRRKVNEFGAASIESDQIVASVALHPPQANVRLGQLTLVAAQGFDGAIVQRDFVNETIGFGIESKGFKSLEQEHTKSR